MDAIEKSLKFENGKLTKVTAPRWYTEATKEDGVFDDLLSRAGVSALDSYGENADTITIYRTPKDAGYLVISWDTNEIISVVFIDTVADYMLFKAQYIAPLAQLIMASEQHWVWQEDRKKNRS